MPQPVSFGRIRLAMKCHKVTAGDLASKGNTRWLFPPGPRRACSNRTRSWSGKSFVHVHTLCSGRRLGVPFGVGFLPCSPLLWRTLRVSLCSSEGTCTTDDTTSFRLLSLFLQYRRKRWHIIIVTVEGPQRPLDSPALRLLLLEVHRVASSKLWAPRNNSPRGTTGFPHANTACANASASVAGRMFGTSTGIPSQRTHTSCCFRTFVPYDTRSGASTQPSRICHA